MKHICVTDCQYTIKSSRSAELFSLTSKAHKEAKENRIEEAKADCKNVLMDNCGHCKHKQHGSWSETLLRYLEE